jgi:hypothetical protein
LTDYSPPSSRDNFRASSPDYSPPISPNNCHLPTLDDSHPSYHYWSSPDTSTLRVPELADSPPMDHSPTSPLHHWSPPRTLIDTPPSFCWSPPGASPPSTDYSPSNPEPSLANPAPESLSKSKSEDFFDKLLKGKLKRHISDPSTVNLVRIWSRGAARCH